MWPRGLPHPGPRFVGHVGIVDHFALADADIAVIDAFEAALLTKRRVYRAAAPRDPNTGNESCEGRKSVMFEQRIAKYCQSRISTYCYECG